MKHQLDTSGLFCPEPLMLVRQAMRKLELGECLCVTATDPSTKRDLEKFCHFVGHTLAVQQEEAGSFYFELIKNA